MVICPDFQRHITPLSLVRSSIQGFYGFLINCKNKEYIIKNKGARVIRTLYIDFSDAQGRLLRSSWWDLAEIQAHQSFNNCPCYLQEWRRFIPKNESQHFSHYKSMGIFPEAQWWLTPHSLVRFCQISNQIKLKAPEWSHGFLHYNPMWATCICCHRSLRCSHMLFVRKSPKTCHQAPSNPHNICCLGKITHLSIISYLDLYEIHISVWYYENHNDQMLIHVLRSWHSVLWNWNVILWWFSL